MIFWGCVISSFVINWSKASLKKTQQTTLEGEILQEYTYYLIGFVPVNVVRLKKEVKFSKLCDEQIKSVEKFLESKS